jgi:hypothetical protein
VRRLDERLRALERAERRPFVLPVMWHDASGAVVERMPGGERLVDCTQALHAPPHVFAWPAAVERQPGERFDHQRAIAAIVARATAYEEPSDEATE